MQEVLKQGVMSPIEGTTNISSWPETMTGVHELSCRDPSSVNILIPVDEGKRWRPILHEVITPGSLSSALITTDPQH